MEGIFPLCLDVISGWEVVIFLLAALAVGSQGCQQKPQDWGQLPSEPVEMDFCLPRPSPAMDLAVLLFQNLGRIQGAP